MLKKWDEIPDFMKCEEVKFYYDILLKKKLSIKVKRIFDIALASFMLIILAVPMISIAPERIRKRLERAGCSPRATLAVKISSNPSPSKSITAI